MDDVIAALLHGGYGKAAPHQLVEVARAATRGWCAPTAVVLPDVMPDPFDHLIEQVVHAGGAVEFVASERLAALRPIGLLLR